MQCQTMWDIRDKILTTIFTNPVPPMMESTMIASANFDRWTSQNDKHKLIQLIRQLNPQSTSREIEDEELATYDRNRHYDDWDRESSQ